MLEPQQKHIKKPPWRSFLNGKMYRKSECIARGLFLLSLVKRLFNYKNLTKKRAGAGSIVLVHLRF